MKQFVLNTSFMVHIHAGMREKGQSRPILLVGGVIVEDVEPNASDVVLVTISPSNTTMEEQVI